MMLKLEREGSSIITYVNLDNVYNIIENNGIFEMKQGASTIASFSVANTTVSYCNSDGIIETLPQDSTKISEFLMKV